MTFSIALDQFRVFSHVDYTPIRPITLLTGGNSAGKSSFLAALRYISDLDNISESAASFNKDPFYLGAYEQIAHYRGGKSGRSKTFSFKFKARTKRANLHRRSPAQSVEVEICFGKRLSQPAIKHIHYAGERSECRISLSDDWKYISVDAWLDGKNYRGHASTDFLAKPENILQSPSQSAYFIEFAIRNSMEEDDYRKSVLDIVQIRDDFQGALSAIPHASYVGAPVRSRPSRTYDPVDVTQQSEGAHVPSRLAQLARTDPQEWKAVREMMAEFGKSSTLFTDLEVRSLGRSDSDPFQVNVVINGPKRNIVDVGYGVSQAIPILFEIYSRRAEELVLVQQPEVHLHPQAQAALGSLICRDISRKPGYIVVETHSDFLIDRIRRHVREGVVKAEDISLLYFERNGLSADISLIDIDKDGEINSPPGTYRDFFFREEMENLGLDVSDN